MTHRLVNLDTPDFVELRYENHLHRTVTVGTLCSQDLERRAAQLAFAKSMKQPGIFARLAHTFFRGSTGKGEL